MPENPPGTIHGWNSYAPIFAEVIARVKPKLIIEVGSWKGASACHMLSLAPEAHIFCVDTWLGSREHETIMPPDLEGEFWENVRKAGFADRVTSLGMTSAEAAIELAAAEVVADLIYIDAAHDLESVTKDIAAYWPLLRPGGIMLGDDYNTFTGVRDAVNAFAKPNIYDNHWWFGKPPFPVDA